MEILVTGSSGVVGSEAVRFFDGLGFSVLGIDNNLRAEFFGPQGDTTPTRRWPEETCPHFSQRSLDIRGRETVGQLFEVRRFDLVVHCAAQPSPDLAAKRPYDDFDVNALGTLHLLESCRRHGPGAVFIHVSTNKVYGDGPNRIRLRELETRWDYDDPRYITGIPEDFPVDQCLHSLFGASKLAGDVLAQEYGRHFGLKTGIFPGGCLTGPQHAGVELHGFLNYLVRVALREGPYTVFGYKGKQVRDQIHAQDVMRAFWAFAQQPWPGEVYNLGGDRDNAAGLLECVDAIERKTGKRPKLTYSETNRIGDHICYDSDLSKVKATSPAGPCGTAWMTSWTRGSRARRRRKDASRGWDACA